MTAALEAVHASKRYGRGCVLNDVSLDVRAGEVHALVGLNGAGKTTLMRLLLGMTRPDSGKVFVNGQEPTTMSFRQRGELGHLVGTPLAYPELTVLQNLELAARLAGLTGKAAAQTARRMTEELALSHWAGTRARKLSSGNCQRLGLAAALIAGPAVLILDEPTNALDPSGVIIVRKVLLERARHGMATLVPSHHLDEVARTADRITVMNGGRLIGTLEPTDTDLERRFFNMVCKDDEVAS